VKQRLLNRGQELGEPFDALLTRFTIERLLYRLCKTPHVSRFILKGATLFSIWMDRPHRPTRDVDLLGSGDLSLSSLENIFREVCARKVEPDGIEFDPDSVKANEIREGQIYQGLRVKLLAHLGKARIAVQVDVGLGDAVTPKPIEVTFRPLLDFPAPVLRAYPPEVVIAEKLQAAVTLDMANSRMKDLFDMYTMSQVMAFDGRSLADAVLGTFRRRRTPVPQELPTALTDRFVQDTSKMTQWTSFVRRVGQTSRDVSLGEVVAALARFLGPVLLAAANNRPFALQWPPAGPWEISRNE